MKTTIYELLGMIKDNKAPKKIKYDGYTYQFDNTCENYVRDNDWGVSINWDYVAIKCLNEPVEILETTITYKQDTIKKVDEPYDSCIFKTDYEFATELEKKIIDNIELIRKKQDEIINRLNMD